MRKRLFSIISAFLISVFLVTGPVVEAQADVATVTVVGGTIGTIGAGLSALLPPAAVILTVGLAAAGIDIYISNASEEQGITKTEFVQNKIVEYSEKTQYPAEEIANGILSGVTVAKDGVIYFGQESLNKIKQIGNWITGSEGTVYQNYVQTLPSFSGGYQSGNIPLCSISSGTIISGTTNQGNVFNLQFTINNTQNLYGFQYHQNSLSGKVCYCIISRATFSGTVSYTGGLQGGGNIRVNNAGNWYYTFASPADTLYSLSTFPMLDIPLEDGTNTLYSFVRGLSTDIVELPADIPDTFYGGDWSDFVPGLSLPDGYEGAIDLGVIGDLEQVLDDSRSYDLAVDSFLEAIKEAIDTGVADVPLSIPYDGSMVVAPDVPMVITPEYEQVAPVDIPSESDKTVVIDNDSVAPPSDVIGAMTLQLKDVFPFCIPFDLYDLLSKFNATPEAPHINISFTLPIVNQQVSYNFDLSPFNSVASILRTMELVASVVGLAIATRAIYIRS